MLIEIVFKVYCATVTFKLVEASKKDIMCEFPSDYSSKQCFDREVIVSIVHSPNQITVDKTSNHLYFSFDSGQGEYIPAKVLLGNNTIKVLKGVKDAFAMASDAKTGDIYFGGSHGIYNYNPRTKSLKRLAVKNLDIWWLFVKESIYFIKFPSLNAYRYENKTIKYMSQLKSLSIHQFVLDFDGNIFFINNTGLFGIKSSEYKTILLTDRPKFMGMATDNNGIVYLCNEDGIYVMTKVIQKVKRVLNIQGVLGITFDKHNNIIYTDSHEIVRLSPVQNEPYYKTDIK